MFFSSLHKLQLLTPGLGSFHRPWKHQHHQPLPQSTWARARPQVLVI